MKILIVDDEKITRQWFQFCIEKNRRRDVLTAEAANGKEALKMIDEFMPDLVFTDIKMPVMDGLALLKEIKSRGLSCKVVLLTSYADFKYVREALRLGAVEYLLKAEIQESMIVSMLDKMIEERKLEKSLSSTVFEDIAGGQAPDARMGRLIDEALRYIEQNYDRQITLTDVASHVHLNPSYLSQLFKEKTGENFSAFLTLIRLKKAEEYLRHTDLKTYEIAEKVGYPNLSYFSRLFKKYKGASPIDYRNQ